MRISRVAALSVVIAMTALGVGSLSARAQSAVDAAQALASALDGAGAGISTHDQIAALEAAAAQGDAMALWQLGLRRFEDAQFCHDGGCRLCEVMIDGKPQLACKSIARDGQVISFVTRKNEMKKPLCYCKQVSQDDFQALLAEGGW